MTLRFLRGRSRLALIVVALVAASACGSNSGPVEAQGTTLPPSTTTEALATTTVATTSTTTTTITPPEPVPIEPADGWELVWHDEFEGDTLDRSNWTFDLGAGGWGNGESQFYTDRTENARVQDGLLVIEARQERYEDSYYTSARLKTQGLQEFQYGRIEARMKVPEGAGMWPAFWMLGATFEEDSEVQANTWPFVGEIDIMEYVGREPTTIFGTVHGPGYSGALGLGKWNQQDHDIADEFHTYAVEWNVDGISWFYDDELYHTLVREGGAVGEREWVFDHPFFIIINLAAGGTFPGPIGLDTVFPAYVYVDHVRVYQPTAG